MRTIKETLNDDINWDDINLENCKGEYEDVLMKLGEYQCGEPTRKDTEELFKRVKVYMDYDLTFSRLKGIRGLFEFAGSQLSVLKTYFILTALIIIIAGVYLTSALYRTEHIKLLLCVSPLTVSCYFIYSYLNTDKGHAEMEMSCVFTPFEIFYTRVILVILFDFLVGLAVLPFIPSLIWRAGFLSLLVSWTVPLVVSAAFTLLCVVALGYLKGGIFSAVIWVIALAADDKLGSWGLFINPGMSMFVINRVVFAVVSLTILVLLFKYKDRLEDVKQFG